MDRIGPSGRTANFLGVAGESVRAREGSPWTYLVSLVLGIFGGGEQPDGSKMESAGQQRHTEEREPTEGSPETGYVLYGDVERPFSAAFRFVDDEGAHVIRSVEFDVYGEGDTLDEAVQDFINHAEDYYDHLASLYEVGEAAENEAEQLALLGRRLRDAYLAITQALERERQEPKSLGDIAQELLRTARATVGSSRESEPESSTRPRDWSRETSTTTSKPLRV